MSDVAYDQWRIRSDWFDFVLWLYERKNMTPAEIAKLTEQAKRGKALMVRSSTSGDRAKTVFDNYEKTLAAFDANVETVSKRDADLSAAMSAMGNAGPILEEAFQDEKPAEPVGVRAAENAHLPAVNGKT